jgi:type I restriction enzyme S subunit
LLEGLEIKEIRFKNLHIDNDKFRIDDEFYLKKYLNAYHTIKSKPHKQIVNILEVLSDFSANGSYESIAANFTLLDEEDYAYMVRSTDLEKSDFTTNVKYVSEHSYNFLEKSKLFGGEILINKIGNPGRVYMMPELNKPVSLGMNLFMLRLSDKSIYKEKYVWAFFNTEIGQNIIKRKVNGTAPLTIDKEAVRTLYLPLVSSDFQENIDKTISNSESTLVQSKLAYLKAESILLNEVKFDSSQLNTDSVNIKNFKESFGKSKRLDAEYYQIKYEQVIEKIITQKHDTLNCIVEISKSLEPGSNHYSDEEEGLPFYRVSDYNKFGLSKPDKELTRSFVADNKDLIDNLKPKKGTILFSKDGSVGTAYLLRNDLDGITSGAILHLQVKNKKEILPEYLTLALNSKLVQMQAERDAGGSIILHWRKEEIEQVVVPIIDFKKQEQIAELVEESFKLKVESERLLEVAKKAVEMAIETDESTATKFIKDNTI